jgi:hypothetical protein
MYVDGLTLQFILRGYRHLSHVLHGFDIGASCIGYDGKDIWVTSIGAFAYTFHLNIVDLKYRSTSYEYRLRKYFKALSFGIVFHDMSVSAVYKCVENTKLIELPMISIKVREMQEFHLYGEVMLKTPKKKSDYMKITNGAWVPYHNLRSMMRGNKCIMSYQNGNWTILLDHNYLNNWVNGLAYIISNETAELASRCINVKLQSQLQEFESNGIEFNIANPTTQTYGIFNPIITNGAEWYGEFYDSG